MNTKENRPSAATLERNKAETAARRAAISNTDSNTGEGKRQGVFDILPKGEEHAIPGRVLAQMVGVTPRTLRTMVDSERMQGCFILASDAGYFRPDDGPRGLSELRRFVRRTDARLASNRRTTAKIRAALREAERGPLDGQTDLWSGE